jgi:CheY-specific phosphatase CheX
MTGARELLVEATELVLCTLADCSLTPAVEESSATAPVVGVVHIRGVWEGTVAVYLSTPLARHLAGIMFDCEPEAATPEQVIDTVGEMANMIGGSLKSLLAGRGQLSLPTVIPTSNDVPRFRSRQMGQFTFSCRGSLGRVVLTSQHVPPQRSS